MRRVRTSLQRGAQILGLLVFVGACSSGKPYRIQLMPAPEIFANGVVSPFQDDRLVEPGPAFGMLYATDRKPAGDEGKARFYENERGHLLRIGRAGVELAMAGITWEEARRISLLKNRTKDYPLQVSDVEEIGVLADSITVLDETAEGARKSPEPGRRFADRINQRLEESRRKDVFIYVHGFKVTFENPLLVASELWHFLGYGGAFIAYAWPSTPSVFAYASDIETAAYTSRNLRILIQFLARETRAEKIHIIGYSAGARVVSTALYQLALLHNGEEREEILDRLRIGQVILTGSDVDRDIFAGLMVDGVVNVPEAMNVYLSETDQALGFSAWFFGRNRVGQITGTGELGPAATAFLEEHDFIRLIDVTGAQDADAANGHAYFRDSPWVSSDVLITLMTGRSPDRRGLVPSGPGWKFPENYLTRLHEMLKEAPAGSEP